MALSISVCFECFDLGRSVGIKKGLDGISDKLASWISRNVWKNLDPSLKVIVAPKHNQGIIKLKNTESLAKEVIPNKLKILEKDGDSRIYGKQQLNGHIIFNKYEGH